MPPLVILLAALIMGAALVMSTALFSTVLVICVTVIALSLPGAAALVCRAANRMAAWHHHCLDQAVAHRLVSRPYRQPQLPDVCSRCADDLVTTRREQVTS
jgi:hypothetical protein